ncbi:MAG: hypothetical protein DCF30_04585 [Hyphomicrobiales bacterium]|nr:MAG: hypothetical protein DCF30_04585 [Hyphomicrobiales bacterium]
MATTVDKASRQNPITVRHRQIGRRTQSGWGTMAMNDLSAHIGTEKVMHSLQMFTTSLEQSLLVLKDYSIDFQRQRHEVHDLASVSGFLGFSDLFQACLTLLAQSRACIERRETVIAAIEDALTEARMYLAVATRSH